MYEFIKLYEKDGSRVHPGVIIKRDLIETETTVSVKGSEFLANIPKEYLTPYTPPVYVKQTKKKATGK